MENISKIAILVDGGFYRKRAKVLFGDKSANDRASELITYCMRHIREFEEEGFDAELYRIFYYDCPPAEKNIFNPLTGKSVNLKKEPLYTWSKEFFDALMSKRKVALRMGELLESDIGYSLKSDIFKKLCSGEIDISSLTIKDLSLDITQKGVDMRIGLDISSIAYKKQADKIVLIAGDSDFVPAAKHARREGIDFILDPMWQPIKPSLHEHIDGLKTVTGKPGSDALKKDKLYKK